MRLRDPLASAARGVRVMLALSIAMLALASAARADWPPLAGPGVPVCEPPANPNLITSAPDGSGGMIVSWLDARGGAAGYRVYVRRISGDGDPLWTDGGVALNTARTAVDRPVTVSDFAGGAIVVWRDFRADTAGDLYAQRVHGDGTPAWAANGIAVTSGLLHERRLTAVGDGAGGVFVAWTDDRTGVPDVRVQHIDAGGAPLWPAAGVGVSPPTSTQPDNVVLAADLGGGVFVGWTMFVGTHFSPFVQHLDPAGSSLWAAGGVLASTSVVGHGATLVGLAADGIGGALAALSDDRSQNSWQQAFGQRVDASGNVAWAPDGVSLSGPAWPVYEQFALADGSGGGIFAWRRYENGGGVNGVYAQRVSAAGNKLWAPGAVLVANPIEGNGMEGMRAVSDGAGGAVLAWNSQRSLVAARPFDVLAQRLGPAGNALWLPGGQLLASSADNALYQTTLVPDGTGGGVAGWIDTQNFLATYRVGAERIHGDGTLGVPPGGSAGVALCGAPSPARASGSLSVRFSLATEGRARVRLFDTNGRLVRELWNGPLTAGVHRVPWDGRDEHGARVRAALYVVSLESAAGRSSARWVVVQ